MTKKQCWESGVIYSWSGCEFSAFRIRIEIRKRRFNQPLLKKQYIEIYVELTKKKQTLDYFLYIFFIYIFYFRFGIRNKSFWIQRKNPDPTGSWFPILQRSAYLLSFRPAIWLASISTIFSFFLLDPGLVDLWLGSELRICGSDPKYFNMFWKSSLLSPGLVGVVLALKVPQLAVRKQNLGSAVQSLTTIASLHQTQPTIQVLLSSRSL